MNKDWISYKDTCCFSTLIEDYLDENPQLGKLYNRYPNIENFAKQIVEKKQNFSANPQDINKREILTNVLTQQYKDFDVSDKTRENIALLGASNTYTITTGHQLNLFSGPLYFLYKIITTINLCKELKVKYPENNFVPIYWMATEDHDFEEINHFNFKGRKLQWNHKGKGPVGRFSTEGLSDFFRVYAQELNSSHNGKSLFRLFEETYLKQENLSKATRCLVNELFGFHGLVILDADNNDLKKSFVPYTKEELLYQKAYKEVTKATEKLQKYTIQVAPREINLFYIKDNLRERIIFEKNQYIINNTNLSFTEKEIIKEVETYPERFSPNVIMRPLYQEVILPNLCYIGGGGEIAYWLQLKSFFDSVRVTFPILLLRNSALLITEKQSKKATKLGVNSSEIFLKQTDLIVKKTKELSEIPIDLTHLKKQLKIQFEELHQMVSKTNYSFAGAIEAQETKQIKGLETLEKRLLKAQKKKYSDILTRITALQNELFPNHGLQERYSNFSEFYLDYGTSLIPRLIKELKPLENKFKIITLKDNQKYD